MTLIQSIIIRQDPSLQPVPVQDVRGSTRGLDDQMDVALGLIKAVYAKCIPASCKVSIDSDEGMFVLSFTTKGEVEESDDEEELRLLVKRTNDVLEILRRPEQECWYVTVEGKKLVWNRFKDIKYKGDALLLRQWVERKTPYRHTDISLPPTAEQFIDISRMRDFKIVVRHDDSVCPLRNSSRAELRKRQTTAEDNIEEYLKEAEGHESQPDPLLNETIYSHGLCWKVEIDSAEVLPKGIRSIEELILGGPELRTLLETGAITFQDEEDNWCLTEFEISEAELPRASRENSHLLQIQQREKVEEPMEPVFPGTYILEEWKPDMHLRLDRIEFKMTSQETNEVRSHVIVESRPEIIPPEKLEKLLWKGMEVLLKELDLEEDEGILDLVQEEIDDRILIREEQDDEPLQYERLGIKSLGLEGTVIEAIFRLGDREYIGVPVTEYIYLYVRGAEYSNGLDPDIIDDEVRTKLSKFVSDDDFIEERIKEVKRILEEHGVWFKEY